MKGNRNLLLGAAVVCLLAGVSVAQTAGAAAGKSSKKASAASESGEKKGAMKDGGSSTTTGCLSGPNTEGAFILTNGRYRKGVEVGGNDDLKSHVGHRVQLTGSWVGSGAAIGEKEDAAAEKAEKKEGKKEAAEKHFKVASIKMLADSCTTPEPAGAKSKAKAK